MHLDIRALGDVVEDPGHVRKIVHAAIDQRNRTRDLVNRVDLQQYRLTT